MNEAIHTIMTKNPIALSPKHTIADVESLFKHHRIPSTGVRRGKFDRFNNYI